MMQKLNKIPGIVWSLLLMVAYGIKNIYDFVANAFTDADLEEIIQLWQEIGTEMEDGVILSTGLVNAVTVITTVLVSVVIFEIAVYLVHRLLLRRGCIRVNRQEFKARIAFFTICACLVSGVFGAICFAIPDYFVGYIYTAINMTIEVAALVTCFFFSAKEWFFPRRYAKSYLFAWIILYVYLAVVYIANILIDVSVGVYIGDIVSAVNVLVLAGLSIIPYFVLKKYDLAYDEPTIVSVDENALNRTMDGHDDHSDGNPDDKGDDKKDIFKDLGL